MKIPEKIEIEQKVFSVKLFYICPSLMLIAEAFWGKMGVRGCKNLSVKMKSFLFRITFELTQQERTMCVNAQCLVVVCG